MQRVKLLLSLIMAANASKLSGIDFDFALNFALV